MNRKTALFWGMLVFGLIGCAASPPDRTFPAPRPLGSDLPTFRAHTESTTGPEPSAFEDEEPADTLTLRQALALALMKNPELSAFSSEIRAREAAALQAGRLPNPHLGADMEDIGVGTETTLRLSQLIETGGKRAARIEVASLNRDLAGWDYETKRIDVLTRVSQTFIEVLSAQQNITLAEERGRLAEEVARVVSERVRAGKVSPIEETRANVGLSSAKIELERAGRSLDLSRKRLAAAWGNTIPRFEKVAGNLGSLLAIPPVEQLAQRLSQNPDLARWATEISQRQAVIDLERSRTLPDMTLSGGVRRFDETRGDRVCIVGLTIPLPIFNRNQGGIQEAQHRLQRAKQERRAAEVRVATALSEAYRALSRAHSEAQALQEHLLPGAEQAFEAVNEGYRLGKFGLLDVLDAQRTFFSARAQHLRALADYHQAVAEVERLIGEPLDVTRFYSKTDPFKKRSIKITESSNE
ncbi:MAG: TolC family protein [Candidatus Manganitrophus sp.]|nr:MAG: TolC family protein [Candidatus Manganitrophus sp.]